MRNRFPVFLITSISLFGCSSPDSTPAYKTVDLIGKWYETSGNTPECEKDYINFDESHEFTGVHMAVTPTGCLATDAIGNNYGQQWQLKGNTITIFFRPRNSTTDMTIKELDENGLRLQYENGSSVFYSKH